MKKRLLTLLGIVAIGHSLSAQIDYNKYPTVTKTILLKEVNIQKSPADSFGIGDILIQDGYIKQVARNIAAPPSAEIIQGDSSYVYPAFIDGLSHTGIPKSDDKKERADVKFRGHPPNSVVGITPERMASDELKSRHESMKKLRKAGFAVSHVVPRGSMLPGQGVVILLGDQDVEDLILSENTSQYFQLKGTRGYYPSTIIGVMAKWRDLYRNAELRHRHKTKFSSSPLRLQKDKSLESLGSIVSGSKALYTKAEKAKSLHRAIALQNDLGYRMVLTNTTQAHEVLDKIKKYNLPVMISTKLPKEIKEDKKDEKKELSEEAKSLLKKKKESYNAYVAQAAVLAKNNIAFGFSTVEGVDKLQKNLRIMMKAGLTKQAALAALTTQPAKILGIQDKVGSISNGKIANLIICDKPYFLEGGAIKQVFVDGVQYKIDTEKKGTKKGEASKDFLAALVGKWSYSVETPMGVREGTAIISNEDELSISMIDSEEPDDPLNAYDITTSDDSIEYTIDVDVDGTSIPAKAKISIEEGTMEGTISMEGLGSMPIKGSKISSPEK